MIRNQMIRRWLPLLLCVLLVADLCSPILRANAAFAEELPAAERADAEETEPDSAQTELPEAEEPAPSEQADADQPEAETAELPAEEPSAEEPSAGEPSAGEPSAEEPEAEPAEQPAEEGEAEQSAEEPMPEEDEAPVRRAPLRAESDGAVGYPAWHLTSNTDGTYTLVFDEDGEINGFIQETEVLEALGDRKDQVSSIRLHDGITSIGTGAFQGWESVKTVEMPTDGALEAIGASAFAGCTGLQELVIPASVTELGDGIFDGCSGLKTVEFSAGSSLTTLPAGLFSNLSSLEEVGLPDSLEVIPEKLFQNTKSLKNVSIPSGVTEIGSYAYSGCTGLTSVKLPEGVTGIGSYAFSNCTELTAVKLPSSLKTIGDSAFMSCKKLGQTTIPDGVTEIGSSAFYECMALPSLVIPENMTKIGSYAFGSCHGLRSVVISGNDLEIGNYAFYDSRYFTSLVLNEGIKTIGNNAFYCCYYLPEVHIPDSVTSLGAGAFQNCWYMRSATIGSGVRSIPSGAFYSTAFTTIDIPENVTSIDSGAFGTSLQEIRVAEDNPSYASVDGVLYNKSMTNLVMCPKAKKGSYVIPEGVTNIGYQAFRECTGLESVILPASASFVSSYAFGNCTGLKEITLSDDVGYISSDAFNGCTNLSTLRIQAGMHTVRQALLDSILKSSTAQKYIRFEGPNYFTYTGDDYSTGKLTLTEGQYYVDEQGMLYRLNEDGTATLMVASDDASNRIVTIPETVTGEDGTEYTVTRIGEGCFNGCKLVTEVTIPDTVVSIDAGAFEKCPALTSVHIGDGVTEIGDAAFKGCTALSEVDMGSGVTEIGDEAFRGCTALTEIEVGSGVERIGDSAFRDCTALERADISDSVTEIGDSAFLNCTALSEVNMGDAVTKIGASAFENCTALDSVVLPDTVSEIGSRAFYNCTALASVNGESILSTVLDRWSSCGANGTTFQNTALWDTQSIVTEEVLTAQDDTGRNIKLHTARYEVLTGESVLSTLTIDAGNDDSNSVTRIYFQFENESGHVSGFETGQTYRFKCTDGSYIEGKLCQTDVANVWFMEIEPLKAGQTINLSLYSEYPNYSPGGTALIWLRVMDRDDAEQDNGVNVPERAHQVTWGTLVDTYPVTKTSWGINTFSLGGDGTADGDIVVKNLAYMITVQREGDAAALGRDLISGIDFVDTPTLPEGIHWRTGLIEAVRQGNWYSRKGTFDKSQALYVTIDGTNYCLCDIEGIPYLFSDIRPTVDSEGNLQIRWSFKNKAPDNEISSFTAHLWFQGQVLVADVDKIQELVTASEEPITLEFPNRVDVTEHFYYSEDQVRSAETVRPLSVGRADYTLSKFIHFSTGLGKDGTFSISLSNNSPLPYYDLNEISDPLSTDFYLRPENMATMFFSDKHGPELSVVIENATICTPVSRQVVGTDGDTYTVTQQNEGIDTPHSGKTSADQTVATDATITIAWTTPGEALAVKVSYDGHEKTYPVSGQNIAEALDKTGYVVTKYAQYTCSWDLTDDVLYSGENRINDSSYRVRSTMKDTFMLLLGDQDWFIVDNEYYYRNSISNTAFGHTTDGANDKSSTDSYYSALRDFTLNKDAYLNGKLADESTSLEAGNVLTYRTDITRTSGHAYDILPLIDRMQGGQVLLVSVGDNASLAECGLETMTVQGRSYYILDKPGEYRSVKVGNYLADRVTVEKGAGGADTMIYWYLTGFDSSQKNVTVRYLALVDPDRAGLSVNGESYTLNNEVWLNDHQSHRLYDRAFLHGTILKMNKYIVTNLNGEEVGPDHDPQTDALTERSSVTQGETVTYRLMLEGMGDSALTVGGSAMRDVLPASLNGYWKKGENISIAYLPDSFEDTNGTEGTVTYVNGDAWHIEGDENNPNQQYIIWEPDFSVTMHYGRLYIYVTLTFPTGDEWAEYGYRYGSQVLCNRFHVYHLYDEVYHDLSIPAGVLLQKGVALTGSKSLAPGSNSASWPSYGYNAGTAEDSLFYYNNDAYDYGLVSYYITLYNSGESRVYLSDIQDVLPKGFTYDRLYLGETMADQRVSSTYGGLLGNGYAYNLFQIEGATAYKLASVNVTTSTNDDGQQILTFRLTNENAYGSYGNLSYDEERGRYYLNPGEAVTVAYNCRTNGYADTEDYANNVAAMPYYDYNGAGTNLDTETVLTRKNPGGRTPNDGERYLLTNGQVGLMGMSTRNTHNGTEWLASDVTVQRERIMPGITKRADSSYAYMTDPVTWTVTAYNSGMADMRDYTLTDVMMAPYQFAGAVGLRIGYDRTTYYWAETDKLFTIGPRSQGDETVQINNTTLTVNGDPVRLAVSLNTHYSYGTRTVFANVEVSLSRDDRGWETLTVHLPSTQTNIPANGYAALTVRTENTSDVLENKTYVNTCYLTPNVQSFDTEAVSQGNYVLLDGTKESVVNEDIVNVSYGYATSSMKAVEETGNPENKKTSVSSTNYIVLPDVEADFRYSLIVNNTGGGAGNEAKAMELLVMIDNLPQKDDHMTFYEEIQRYSDFKVDFAEDPDFAVTVQNGDNVITLDPGQYRVEYSAKTEFTPGDWSGGTDSGDQWYTLEELTAAGESVSRMRSFRLVIEDDTGTVIPPAALVTASFGAKVAEGELPRPSAVAWNSFGYHYSLISDHVPLEAAPQKVGIKMPSVPSLVKKLVDVNGDPYAAEKNETFEFVIYEGEPISLPDGFAKADVLAALKSNDRKFAVVPLTVPQGADTSETRALDGLWRADENGNETETAWIWRNMKKYTWVELSQGADSNYYLSADQSNNSLFYYVSADPIELVCTNVRDSWNLKVLKKDTDTEAALSGAVFGLYTQNQEDRISEQAYQTMTANLSRQPDQQTTIGDATWYLKDIRITDTSGTITWNALIEESYYLLELQAPEGHRLNATPGQTVAKPAAGADKTVTVAVTNPEVKDLTISKTVTGNAGSRDKYFRFTVTLSGAAPGEYTVDLSHADAVVASNSATLADYAGRTNPETLTVAADGTGEQDFYLQHGQSITVTGLTKETEYTVAETAEDYVSTVTDRNESGTITTDDVTVAFVNSRNMDVPTGADSIPYTAMMLFAALPAIAVCKRRRQKSAAQRRS